MDKLETLIDVYDSLEEIGSLNDGDFAARELTKIKHNQVSMNLTRKWFSRSKGLCWQMVKGIQGFSIKMPLTITR